MTSAFFVMKAIESFNLEEFNKLSSKLFDMVNEMEWAMRNRIREEK